MFGDSFFFCWCKYVEEEEKEHKRANDNEEIYSDTRQREDWLCLFFDEIDEFDVCFLNRYHCEKRNQRERIMIDIVYTEEK